MKYDPKIYLLFAVTILFLLLAMPQANAQYPSGNTSAVPEQKWQELTNDEAFGYRTEKEKTPDKNAGNPNTVETLLLFILSFLSSSIGRFFIWLLFFFLLGWVLFKIFFHSSFFAARPRQPDNELPPAEHIEEDLLSTNWEQRLNQAVKENNLPLAIKYSYLRLLQLLQQKELIAYRNDKTNRDYYYELKDTDHHQPFRQLTNLYEFVWYGNYPLSQQQYDAYMHTFQSLKTRIAS